MTHPNFADITKASDDELRVLAQIREREAEERREINAVRAAQIDAIEAQREEEAARQRALDLRPTLAVATMLREALGDRLPDFLSATARDVSFAQVRKILSEHVAAEAQRKRGLVA